MRLRFTIRDLLWLAVVVAVCAAWWLDHRDAAIRHLEDDQRISKLARELAATSDALKRDETLIKFFDNRSAEQADSLKNLFPIIKSKQQ